MVTTLQLCRRTKRDTIQRLTQDTFDEVAAGTGIAAIDFWAAWCWPCRAMGPQFERAAEMRPQYRCAKVDVDVDEQPALARRFGITSIPTLLVLRDGQPVAAETGVIGAEHLARALDRLAAAGTQDTPAVPEAAEVAR
jgi:thioredoxin 1